MRVNPCHLKYVLVHGRKSEFLGNSLRRSLIQAREASDFKIMTYDSLVEALDTKGELYVGARKNEHIELLSTKFLEETIFAWIDPTLLLITDELRADAQANRAMWNHYQADLNLVMDAVLPRIGRCRPDPSL
jgi:hypothetical protein